MYVCMYVCMYVLFATIVMIRALGPQGFGVLRGFPGLGFPELTVGVLEEGLGFRV